MAHWIVRLWTWARGWLFTTNHKRVGVLYLWVTFVWFLFAGLDGMAIRAELATPQVNVFKPDLYDALFTFHGSQMLFFFAIPVFSAFGNFFIPTMVGAKDMAFPRMNSLGIWLVFLSGALLRLPLLVREFAAVGWTNYAPLSGIAYSPSLGEDWWGGAVFLETIASTLGGINFLATIVKERRPGLKWGELPVFAWSMFATSALIVAAGPFLLADLGLLFLDRHVGAHFFDPSLPGSALLWQNLFWFYSHPATYIMILPAFGIVTAAIVTFSGQGLFSYKATVAAILGTTILSTAVFWHHMFTTGIQGGYAVFASLMSAAVSVPTAVLFFNWIATLRGGQIRFPTPMLFALGFIFLFGLGGIDGVMLSSIPLDQDLHQTYWLIAHIHLVLFGGSVMGALVGTYLWFPEMFGRRLDERLGKIHFWGTFLGAIMTFIPMHALGLEGMLRRQWVYAPQYGPLNLFETIGSAIIGLAMCVFLINVLWTIYRAPREDDRTWSEVETPEPEPRRLPPLDEIPAEGTP